MHRLGAELSSAYGDGVILVAVLKSSVVFLADLVRAMSVVPAVDFLAVQPYGAGTGPVRIVKDVELDLTGRDVVLVVDLVDTGLTTTYLLGQLGGRRPRSLEVCTLVDKRARRLIPLDPRFRGIVVEDDYLVGYGLDHHERYRNLDGLARADPAELEADPDAYVGRLYDRGGRRV